MENLKLQCDKCKSRDFYCQDGLYFCEECNVQYANLVEMEYDEFNENLRTTHRVRLVNNKSQQKENIKSRRITSWEEYNHILIGLVNEILNIQEIPNFKLTCLQIWMAYLKQTEAAFFNKEMNVAPKLFAYHRRIDAEILYNQKPKERKKVVRKRKTRSDIDDDDPDSGRRRRKQMRKSEKILSSQLCESVNSESLNSSLLANLSVESIRSDYENAELEIDYSKASTRIFKRYQTKADSKIYNQFITPKEKVRILSGKTLLSIIYCALNICGGDIHLSDLVRFVREGHLSYFNYKQFLPDDIVEHDIPLSSHESDDLCMVNYEVMRESISYFIRIIPDLGSSLQMPNFIDLARRYVREMNLPTDISTYIERLIIFLPPEMALYQSHHSVLKVPNYEGRAMAYIIFVLKLFFGIDGYREIEMSKAARDVNKVIMDSGLQRLIFVYEDWRKFIEYRQVILEKFYFPSMYLSSYASDKPYAAYNTMLATLDPKTKKFEAQNVKAGNQARMQSKINTQAMLKDLIKTHEDQNSVNLMQQLNFPSTMTPLKDALDQILSADIQFEINRDIAALDYSIHTCESFLEPQQLVKSLEGIGIELHVKKSTFPKTFVINKLSEDHKVGFYQLPYYELDFTDITEDEWRANFKKRNDKEKDVKMKIKRENHEIQLEEILESRLKWRTLVREKKLCKRDRSQSRATSATSKTNDESEPRVFNESNILSDIDDDESDDDTETDEIVLKPPTVELDYELDQIFKSYTEKVSPSTQLTLVVPDYNVWQKMYNVKEVLVARADQELLLKKLPKSFLWLLNQAASVLHQHPGSLYHQVLCLEHQFMAVYQPVELMKNVLLKKDQKEDPLKRTAASVVHCYTKLEQSW